MAQSTLCIGCLPNQLSFKHSLTTVASYNSWSYFGTYADKRDGKSPLPEGHGLEQLIKRFLWKQSIKHHLVVESKQFAQNETAININGGTSDEFRYNNSESQKHPNSNNIQFGDSISEGGFTEPPAEFKRGDDQLGASGEFNRGMSNTAIAGYSVDRNGLEASVGYEGFYGAKGKVEVHGEYGVVSGKLSAEAQAGALGSTEAGLTIDPRNGVSGQAGAEVFVGGQIDFDAETQLGDSLELKGGVGLKAGFGAEARGEFEFGPDEIRGHVELGFAGGLGADVKFEVSASPTGVIDDIQDIHNAIYDFIKR